MSTESERKQILSMIESGKITPSQGVKLLQALDDTIGEEEFGGEGRDDPGQEDLPSIPVMDHSQVFTENSGSRIEEQTPINPHGDSPETSVDPDQKPAEETGLPPTQVDAPDFKTWRRWMMIPLWTGVMVTILGGILMYLSWMASKGPSFWFACAWAPFLIGIALIALAWGGRSVRWLHIRIQQKTGEWPPRMAFSIPLPLKFLAWIVRIFGDRIPNAKGKGMHEMILALENTSPDAPFYLDVDEGEDGERVQVFIG